MVGTIKNNEFNTTKNSQFLLRQREIEQLNIVELNTKYKSILRTKFDNFKK